jgi:hypothetical protein
LLCGRALAQEGSAADSKTEAARRLYTEGRDLRRDGDLRGSLEKLEAAHALHATPITAMELARAHGLLGQLRAAIDVLESIERMPIRPTESEKARSARVESKVLVVQYRARLARLALRIDGAAAGAQLLIDGDVQPAEAVDAPRLVDPGPHHVEALLGARRVSQDVRVAEGEERVVTLRFPDAVPAAPAAPSPAALAPAPPPRSSPNVLAYVGFGVGAVGVVAGTITGVITLSRASVLKQACTNGTCPPGAGLDSTTTLGTVSTIAFAVAGAGVAVGVGALLFAGGERPDARNGAWVRPWLGVASAGVTGGF